MRKLSPAAQRLVDLYQRGLLMALGLIWLGIGLPSLWSLRVGLGRLLRHFTWTGLRYTLFFPPTLATLGILFCVMMTVYVLISQSRYELFGVFKSEQNLLELQVARIRRQPVDNWVRRWVIGPEERPRD